MRQFDKAFPYYKLVGHDPVPCDITALVAWDLEPGRGKVALTNIGGVRISTVFLPIDHRHVGDGPPILFETMVFGGELHEEQERYCTWDEAERGHAAMVARVLATQ